MKNFAHLYLISVVSLLLLVASLNYWVDPAGIFSKQARCREFSMAEVFSRKNNILIDFNYDERLLQKYRLELDGPGKDVIVIGSSRSLQISSLILERPLLNISVSGAGIEDFIALSVLAKKGLHPKIIIFGVDPWIFNVHYGQSRWKSLSYEYSTGLSVIGGRKYSTDFTLPTRYLQLLNYEYSKESLMLLWKSIRQKQPAYSIRTSDGPTSDADLIRFDGSRAYHKSYVERDQETVKAQAISFASRPDISILNNFVFSDDVQQDFRRLLDYVAKDTTVIIFLPPFHPSAYPLIKSRYSQVEDVERTVRLEARTRGIAVFGSYDPLLAGCGEKDFLDAMHPKDICISKLLRGFSASRPD